MPVVEQRTRTGGHHEFRVQREIGGDECWGPWMSPPEGGLVMGDDDFALPAQLCVDQLLKLDHLYLSSLSSHTQQSKLKRSSTS